MHVLIVGCGRLGALVAMALANDAHQVTVVDTDRDSFRRLPNDLDIRVMIADGTREDELRRAGIESADVVIAVAQHDTRNALAAQIASHTFKVPKVICHLNDPVRQEMFQSMGYEAISSTSVVSKMIIDSLHR